MVAVARSFGLGAFGFFLTRLAVYLGLPLDAWAQTSANWLSIGRDAMSAEVATNLVGVTFGLVLVSAQWWWPRLRSIMPATATEYVPLPEAISYIDAGEWKGDASHSDIDAESKKRYGEIAREIRKRARKGDIQIIGARNDGNAEPEKIPKEFWEKNRIRLLIEYDSDNVPWLVYESVPTGSVNHSEPLSYYGLSANRQQIIKLWPPKSGWRFIKCLKGNTTA